MDGTLAQILQALYEAHRTIDALRQRVAELEAERGEAQKASTTPAAG